MRFNAVCLLSLSVTILPGSILAFTSSAIPSAPPAFATSRTSSTTTELRVAESIPALNEPQAVSVSVSVQDPSTLQQQDGNDISPSPKATYSGQRPSTRKPNKDINFLFKRTRQILAKEHTSSTASNNFVKNLKTFHWLIDAWADSNHPDAPEHALALYNAIQEYKSEQLEGPTIKTLTKVLYVFAKCGRGGDATKAILEEYITSYDNDYDGSGKATMPNVYTYTAILEAYARTSSPPPSFSNALAAQNLCQWMETKNDPMVKPNARSYNAVIRSWGNCGDDSGAIKAEECLKRMERFHIKEQRVMREEGTDGDENGDVANKGASPRPNIWNYNSVLNAWANSSVEDNAQRAEALLNEMGHAITDDDDDASTYDNSLPLRPMPNTVSYNSVIGAYAKNGAGDEAKRLLRTMEERYATGQNTECRPNTRSYNSVMNAYAKSSEKNGAIRAEQILRDMMVAENNGAKPDFVSYATVINAWGRSYEYGKAERVLGLYREMVGLYEEGDVTMRPNVVIFNAVINACAYTIGDPIEQRRAVQIANTMLRELDQSPFGKPDQITYGTFLKVCQNEMPDSEARHQIVDAVFRKSAREGQVGQLVLDQMKTVASPEQFGYLLGGAIKTMTLEDLPHEWTCNVVKGKRHR